MINVVHISFASSLKLLLCNRFGDTALRCLQGQHPQLYIYMIIYVYIEGLVNLRIDPPVEVLFDRSCSALDHEVACAKLQEAP